MPALSPTKTSDNAQAMLWILVSVVAATGMTLCIRFLTPDLHTAMLAFLRSALGLVALVPFLVRARVSGVPLKFQAWKLHVARGICMSFALNSGFYAIWKLPLATATILFFAAPIFVTILAGPILSERVGPRRWAAVIAGFIGAVIILRPGLEGIDVTALIAVLSAGGFAAALVLGKIIAPIDGTASTFVSSTSLTAIFTLPPALFVWDIPHDPVAWTILIVLVVSSSLRTYADIRAYAQGEAGYLAPFSYLRLLTVGLAGYLMFGEVIDLPTMIGGAIIIGSTLYIALREAQLART